MADTIAQHEAAQNLEKPFDASDPAAVNLARKKSSRRARDRMEVVKALMDLPRGREWLYGLLERCHMYSPSFVKGDPHSTSFQEGERNIGNMILADIMVAAPDQYVKMCKEAREQEST